MNTKTKYGPSRLTISLAVGCVVLLVVIVMLSRAFGAAGRNSHGNTRPRPSR